MVKKNDKLVITEVFKNEDIDNRKKALEDIIIRIIKNSEELTEIEGDFIE